MHCSSLLQERWVCCADWFAEGSSARGESCTQPDMEVHHSEDCSWEKDLSHVGAVRDDDAQEIVSLCVCVVWVHILSACVCMCALV